MWALLQEAIPFLLLQQTLFLIKSGDINLASQYVDLTEVTSRCLQTEGGICTWGRIICSLLFRAVKPDLLEICMWVISHSLFSPSEQWENFSLVTTYLLCSIFMFSLPNTSQTSYRGRKFAPKYWTILGLNLWNRNYGLCSLITYPRVF